MLNGAWNIRPATVHDARAIAQVHIESYKTAYQGIFPESLLNALSVENRESNWRALLEAQDPAASITMVATDAAGNVNAFISGGKERTGQLGCNGELYAIYLRPDAQRKGLGALLVRKFAQELKTRGFDSMAVWVLALNPATRFYENLGGKLISQQTIERGGETFVEVAYGWTSLNLP
jgi:GNAT superfamily N-acetyltransferase